jgi:hydroxymethylglutaryl-CoA lyase
MAEQVCLREVGLRDGLQNISLFMPSQQKKDWISAEFAAGVKEIEITSYVPPKLLRLSTDHRRRGVRAAAGRADA